MTQFLDQGQHISDVTIAPYYQPVEQINYPPLDDDLKQLVEQLNSPRLDECTKVLVIDYLYDQDRMPNQMRKAKLFRQRFNVISDLKISSNKRMLSIAIFNPSIIRNIRKARLLCINVLLENDYILGIFNCITDEM